jgi:hypothetical protein
MMYIFYTFRLFLRPITPNVPAVWKPLARQSESLRGNQKAGMRVAIDLAKL